MSERGISPEMKAAVGADVVAPVILFKADFPSGTVRMWSGIGELVIDGDSWYGLGALIDVEASSESIDGAASSVQVKVSGFTPEIFNPVMMEGYQGHAAEMMLSVLNTDTGAMIGQPYVLFSGVMESDQITDDAETSTVTVKTSNILADLLRPREWRYTHEHQQRLHSDDKGLEFVAALQDVDLKWGKA